MGIGDRYPICNLVVQYGEETDVQGRGNIDDPGIVSRRQRRAYIGVLISARQLRYWCCSVLFENKHLYTLSLARMTRSATR